MSDYYTHFTCVPAEVHAKEINYYRGELEIARRIIEQLADPKPWDITFIHPADLCELINRMSPNDLMVSVDSESKTIFGPRRPGPFGDEFTFKGKRYVQSNLVPQKTQNYR